MIYLGERKGTEYYRKYLLRHSPEFADILPPEKKKLVSIDGKAFSFSKPIITNDEINQITQYISSVSSNYPKLLKLLEIAIKSISTLDIPDIFFPYPIIEKVDIPGCGIATKKGGILIGDMGYSIYFGVTEENIEKSNFIPGEFYRITFPFSHRVMFDEVLTNAAYTLYFFDQKNVFLSYLNPFLGFFDKKITSKHCDFFDFVNQYEQAVELIFESELLVGLFYKERGLRYINQLERYIKYHMESRRALYGKEEPKETMDFVNASYAPYRDIINPNETGIIRGPIAAGDFYFVKS